MTAQDAVPANAIEIRSALDDPYAAHALIGYLHRSSATLSPSYDAWTVDLDDITTDAPAPVYLGRFADVEAARDAVEIRYRDWASRQPITASEAAKILGLADGPAARRTLTRWGIPSTGRAPGRRGESLYARCVVEAAARNRPRRGRPPIV
ncbi:hypothetical protein [Amycolatopsis sp. NPDC058986]|uniref:hypothetical protein n=1 Tax=unclassified Amycolatopsis TaxID=2618356 RepID=UPI00366FD4DA